MSRRILLALGALVIWTAITVIVGRLRAGGEAELVEAVTQGFNWTYLLAAAFLLAVVAWQRWDDVGLKSAPTARSLRLLWLPALYIAAFLAIVVFLGLPPIAVMFFVLVTTFFVGLSEELSTSRSPRPGSPSRPPWRAPRHPGDATRIVPSGSAM